MIFKTAKISKNKDRNTDKADISINKLISIAVDMKQVKQFMINNKTKQLQKLIKTTKVFLKLGQIAANSNYLGYLPHEGIKFLF